MSVIDSLAPAFAVGFALQQLLELLDPALGEIVHGGAKKIVLGLISLIIGLLAAGYVEEIRVLRALSIAAANWFDIAATGLIVSAGTEGLNSIVKFLGYAKEDKKEEAKKAGSAVAAM